MQNVFTMPSHLSLIESESGADSQSYQSSQRSDHIDGGRKSGLSLTTTYMTPAARPLPHIRNALSVKYAVLYGARSRSLSSNAAKSTESDHRASSKLFEDAAREEAEEAQTPARTSRVPTLEGQNENWTGEESVQDAVLRMLVDKYKPLRGGPVRTADEKLKAAPPKVSFPEGSSSLTKDTFAIEDAKEQAPRRFLPNEPLLPAVEGHKPWLTTFKVPSHATSNIRYGHFPNVSTRNAPESRLDEKAKKKERETRRRTEQAGRLSRARESTLDYRLGIKGGAAIQKRLNPASLQGWANLVEDRIEVRVTAGVADPDHLRTVAL